ncbi:MAG: MFS transporter [Mycobacterium sp.]
MRRVVLSSLIGTAVEYYDFVLYATMTALVFGRLFFPAVDPGLATVAAFAAFAAGYVSRPIGGILFGHFGDRLGRKRMLVVTMAIMGVGSFLIGLLPTYETVGLAAPAMLVILRVAQGIAIGGEWGGATLMVAEHADADFRGRWNGLMQMGSPIGALLSTGVVTAVTLLGEDALLSWGWRIPFLVSAFLLMFGLYVRVSVSESPVFAQAVSVAASPVGRRGLPLSGVLRRPRTLILATAVGIGPFALTALINTYMLSYAKGIGYPLTDVITASLFSSVTSLLAIPMFSALSDRVGRRAVILGGALAIVVYAVPFYSLVDSVSFPRLAVALVLAQAVQSAMYAPLGALLSEMFDTDVRYTGVSMGYQLAAVLGAGFTPLIASSLLAGDMRSAPLVAIAIGCGAVTVLAVLLINETRGRNLASRIHSA